MVAAQQSMSRALEQVSTGIGQSDLREGIKGVSDLQRTQAKKLEVVGNNLATDVVAQAQNVIAGLYQEVSVFEETFVAGYSGARMGDRTQLGGARAHTRPSRRAIQASSNRPRSQTTPTVSTAEIATVARPSSV